MRKEEDLTRKGAQFEKKKQKKTGVEKTLL